MSFADVFYSTDGGQNWSSAPMGLVSGATRSAQLPAQASPAVVTYYVQATNVGGFVNVLPKLAPADVFHFARGSRN